MAQINKKSFDKFIYTMLKYHKNLCIDVIVLGEHIILLRREVSL